MVRGSVLVRRLGGSVRKRAAWREGRLRCPPSSTTGRHADVRNGAAPRDLLRRRRRAWEPARCQAASRSGRIPLARRRSRTSVTDRPAVVVANVPHDAVPFVRKGRNILLDNRPRDGRVQRTWPRSPNRPCRTRLPKPLRTADSRGLPYRNLDPGAHVNARIAIELDCRVQLFISCSRTRALGGIVLAVTSCHGRSA